MSLFVFAILFTLKGCVVSDGENNKLNYGGWQVWTADIRGRNLSSDIIDEIFKKDVWRKDDNGIDFLLNGTETEYWKRFLDSHNISYTVLLDNVQGSIEKEDTLKQQGARRVDWQSYPDLNAIDSFLKSKARAYPKNCILKTIGKTVQRKEIKMMKVTNGKPGNTAILIEAGIHGREWLAISSVLYFLDTLTANFSALPGPLRHKDWYIIPVVNPDGYEYTMKTDRLWSKNRRKFSGPCDGVDIMSNFDMFYGFFSRKFFGHKESNYDICSREFCGPYAFSEQESIAIRDLIKEVHFTVYVSVHSYGSKFIVPWIGTGRETKDWKAHQHIGSEVIKAMNKVHKTRFTRGTVGPMGVMRTSGTPIDWAYDQGIIHSYLIETRGSSYISANSDIVRSGEEIAAGLRRIGEIVF